MKLIAFLFIFMNIFCMEQPTHFIYRNKIYTILNDQVISVMPMRRASSIDVFEYCILDNFLLIPGKVMAIKINRNTYRVIDLPKDRSHLLLESEEKTQ